MNQRGFERICGVVIVLSLLAMFISLTGRETAQSAIPRIVGSALQMYHVATDTDGAIATSLDAGGYSLYVDEVRLHLSAAGGAGSFTATLDSGHGATYDAVLTTQDMTTATDYVWRPARPVYLGPDDDLDLAYPNANDRAYGVEVLYH